jgi:hypothetical protein
VKFQVFLPRLENQIGNTLKCHASNSRFALLDLTSMDLEVFAKSPVGVLVPISGTDPRTGKHFEHKAFLPAPLPSAG